MIRASPAARRLARANDVDLARVADTDGRGPDGALVQEDVEAAIERMESTADARSGAEPGATTTADGRDIVEERTASPLREAVARQMSTSAREIPQVTLNRAVPVERSLSLTERIEADLDAKLSIEVVLIAAVARALRDHPEFNAIYEDETHKIASNVNVGVAVDTDRGLVVPVLKNTDEYTLTELGNERNRLVSRTLDNDHSTEDLSGGTFTVTNLGHYGVESFDPLVNPPEVAILGVGAIRTSRDPDTGEEGRELPLSLTFDHRPVDGADGARFLDAIAVYLANPMRLLLES